MITAILEEMFWYIFIISSKYKNQLFRWFSTQFQSIENQTNYVDTHHGCKCLGYIYYFEMSLSNKYLLQTNEPY